MSDSEGFITKHEALRAIWKIVHTPTKETRHRSAPDHYQADFDAIRKIIRASGMSPAHRGGEA
jgi:hypothetical protein